MCPRSAARTSSSDAEGAIPSASYSVVFIDARLNELGVRERLRSRMGRSGFARRYIFRILRQRRCLLQLCSAPYEKRRPESRLASALTPTLSRRREREGV